jgi:hypothetical protein
MTNVAQKMRELLAQLKRDGFLEQWFVEIAPKREGEGYTVVKEIAPEYEDQWNEGYAIIKNVDYDRTLCLMRSINFVYNFDHDGFIADFEKWVREQFPGCKVTFDWDSKKIEVRREIRP